ncbi:MAG: M4 family metallopeptidase [Bacteroidetes bacterium]|nr:M4 family metallopeptidase [Bacteroidota bacterium]
MKIHIALLLVLGILFCDGATARGQKKAPDNAVPSVGFQTKMARQRIPTAGQQQLFKTDVANLAERIAAVRRGHTESGVLLTPDQSRAMRALRASSATRLAVHWDRSLGVPVFIQGLRAESQWTGLQSTASDAAAQQSARSFLKSYAGLMKLNDPSSELVQVEVSRDNLGFTHVRYQQMFRGLEVWGRDLRVHVDGEGQVESFNGRYVPTPDIPEPERSGIDAGLAGAIALRHSGAAKTIGETRQVYLPDEAGRLTLCWLVPVGGGFDLRKDVFVETTTGRVVKEYNRIMSDGPVVGSGTDVRGVSRTLGVYQIGSQYVMIDASKSMYNPSQSQFPDDGRGVIYAYDFHNGEESIYYITSTNQNSWSVPSGVSALYTGSKLFDYYKTVHGRNAIDNQGSTMNFAVNFKSNYSNAFWTGQYMVFGNGDGSTFSDLSGAFDVTAHEMTHGVTEWSAGLLYENQSGALNESFSDVFGALFEFWLEGAAGDWLMGEDVFTPGTPGDALRSMSDPGGPAVPAGSRQPANMSEYVVLPNTEAGDYGGVHTNSGIPNKAFYLFATSPGVTKEEAGAVYYRALTTYLTKNSRFVDCRLAVIKAAEDLFGGAGNARALAAATAFDAVGITTGTSTGDPPVDPPVQGTEYVLFVDAYNGRLYRWTVGTTTVGQVSATSLYSRPAVTDNGEHVFYVDQTGNLHTVKSDGTNDQALSTSGGFNNIAVSRSGRYLAATSVYSEPYIYVFDLDSTAGNKVLQLYTPTYHQGETVGIIEYPDRIDWTADETRIMYDAYNTAIVTGGDTLGYWDINTVRVEDGSVARLFAAQARGINIGNPVFASNTDNIMALDRMDENGQVLVLAVNLNTGDAGVVTNNYSSLGSPAFSKDDGKVYYHYIDESTGTYEIWSVDLEADGITGAGNDEGELENAVYPLAFAIGTRPTDVPAAEGIPPAFILDQNYPNPFNPGTEIRFHVPREMRLVLRIYDLLGREVALLAEGQFSPGAHSVRFDASGLSSGVYLYRLEGEGSVQTRRMMLVK